MGAKLPFREKRKSQRLEYPFKLSHRLFKLGKTALASKLSEGLKFSEGEIIDISERGVSFRSSIVYALDSLVYLEIKLGSWDFFKEGYSGFKSIYQQEPFCSLAKVIRLEKEEEEKKDESKYKIAVQYISVDEGHRFAVARFIQAWFKNHKKEKMYENSSGR